MQSLLTRDQKYQLATKSPNVTMRVLEERYEYILQDLQSNAYQPQKMEPHVMDSVWFKISSGEPQLLQAVYGKDYNATIKKSIPGLTKIDGTRWYLKPMFDRFEFGKTCLLIQAFAYVCVHTPNCN